jgi:hypothetical protein
MNTDSGYRLRLPEIDPEGCVLPDSLRAFIEQSTIESPTDVENGGGQSEVSPLDFNALVQQVEGNSNDIVSLSDRVTTLEGHSYPRNGSVSIPIGSTSIAFQVASGLTNLTVTPVGAPLPDLWVSGISGSVTAHWTGATTVAATLYWSQS